jgi:thiol-disulfide isomerase/thioredoxin
VAAAPSLRRPPPPDTEPEPAGTQASASEPPESFAIPGPVITAASRRTGEETLAPGLAAENASWINSEPFTFDSLRGKVLLIDFWTYTCINCIRTLPYLKEWHEKYADKGLVIVGVHTPEFKFEEKLENVVDAVKGFGIKYAVAQDNDYIAWDAYNNRYWPAKYLIDKDGYIRYTHFGEGAYAETEQQIRDLLAETGASLSGIALGEDEKKVYDPEVLAADSSQGLTRELYAGVNRNYNAAASGSFPPYVAHQEFYDGPDVAIEYEDPGNHANHFIYLQGLWHNGLDNLTHARETKALEDYLAIMFFATTVNVVMAPGDDMPYEVRVTIDDGPLQPGQVGADIMFDQGGNSYVRVDEPRMYRLISIPSFGSHELKLSSNSSDFSIFAFTFGGFKPRPES